MKLSKKFLTVLAPVATVSAVAPIASCGSALQIKFGDSVNCLNKDKKFKQIADYHKRDEVYASAKQNCIWVEPGPGSVVRLDGEDGINTIRTIEQMYFDFICSLYKARTVFCIQSSWDDTNKQFTTFNISYQHLNDKDKPEGEIIAMTGGNFGLDDFKYDKGPSSTEEDNKVYISIVTQNYSWSLPSYSYQEATLGG